MTKAEQALALGGRIGLVQAQPWRDAHTPNPSRSLAVVFMALIVALTSCGGSWVWYEGTQIRKCHQEMKSNAPGIAGRSEMEFLARVGQWQLVTTLVMVAGGGLLIAMTVGSFRQRRRAFVRQLSQTEGEWKLLVSNLRAELDQQEAARSELSKQMEQLHTEITNLAREKTVLADELERRRRTERSLAQQRQELARSKDVLELHVQARKQEVAKLQLRSDLILNSVVEGICGFDLQGRVTFANPAAARILDLSEQDMIGKPAESLFPAFKSDSGPTAHANNGFHPVEVVATRSNGSTFAAEYIRSPLHEDKRVVGEVLTFKDVTERKQAAEMLAQRMAELTRSNAELEQFAFVASHDLQEPLRKIQAFGDRLKAKFDEAKLETGRDYLERMQSAAARMQTLINDLLTFSRVIRRTEPFTLVDLAVVVREVLGDLEVRIEKTGAKVEVGGLPTIEADAMQIRQLLQNLIGNALKFQPPGAVPVVKIEGRVLVQPSGRGRQAIFTRQAADGGEVSLGEEFCELTVQDNGIGFDEKYLDKIFAVFSRLHGRQEYEGTGIGLAVCQRIADRHGGHITARSKPGAGATFVVRLPLKQLTQTPQPE